MGDNNMVSMLKVIYGSVQVKLAKEDKMTINISGSQVVLDFFYYSRLK